MTEPRGQRSGRMLAIAACATLLSLITVFNQVKTLGLSWQEEQYRARLEAVAHSNANAPEQYRVLSDTLTLAACRFFESAGVPRPAGSAMVLLRLLQNLALFLLAIAYYRRLGLPAYVAILGIMALAWGMTQSNYNSDLAVNTYSDILLYLGAAIVMLAGRPAWLVPITLLGALNRETSVLLPIMLLAVSLRSTSSISEGIEDNLVIPGTPWRISAWNARIALVSLALYAAIFAGLRGYYGLRPWSVGAPGITPGWELLRYNLHDSSAWGHAAGTLGILPLVALVVWRRWPAPLRAFFWAIIPAWFLAAPFCSVLAESRVWLLPQVLVFLPAALCGLLPRETRPEVTP